MAHQLEKTSRAPGTNGGRLPEVSRRDVVSPLGALLDLRREIDRAFQNFFGGELAVGGEFPAAFGGVFSPQVDVRESDQEISISAELPGVNEKDVTVEVTDGELLITGEKRQEKESQDEGWRMVERSYGSFRRVIPLPQDTDQNAVRARFRDGVLRITVPKTAEAQKKRKKVEITSAS